MNGEWYLRVLVWLPALGFFCGLVFTLCWGKFYERGRTSSRYKNKTTYWTGVVFLVLLLAITSYLAATAFNPN